MRRLAALFLVSGIAALLVETLWLRWFRLLFGATAPAASATLVAFFAGHGLGAAWAARRAAGWTRPLAVYGRLELVAAAGALAVPALLTAAEAASGGVYDGLRERPGLLTAGRFALALLATLPAAAAFGATLPAIGAAALGRAGELGSRGSALYAWNIAGAALGTALAAFLLPDRIGVPATYGLAVGLSAAVGATALWLARSGPGTPPEAPEPPPRPETAPEPAGGAAPCGFGALTGFAALSGLGALAAQVLLVHAFARVLDQSVYAFGAVLVVVLGCLALGAAGVSAAVSRSRVSPETLMALGLGGTALACLAFPAAFWAGTDGLRFLEAGSTWRGYVGLALVRVACLGGPLLLAASLVLPACFALAGRLDPDAGAGRGGALLGRLAAANTVGAIAGALLAPFVLLPGLGLWGAFAGLGALLAAGACLAPGHARARAGRAAVLAGGVLAIGVLADPRAVPPVRLEPGERLVRATPGAAGVVAVVERPDGRVIRTDNHYVLGGTAERVHEERQGHLPLLLHPRARRAAFVGTATGISAGAATAHPLEEIWLVEIVPAVIEAARRDFDEANRGLYRDRRARPVLDDARNFLRATRERFDVVVADLFVPWRSGTGALYAREHFAAVRARLLPDGLFCQWLPLYQLSREEFELVARTFADVFPRAAVFRGDFYGRYPIAALVGWAGQPAPAAEVSAAVSALAARGERDRWVTHPDGFWSLFVGPLATNAGPLNTDARPRLQFLAARRHAGGGAAPFVGLDWLRWSDARLASAQGDAASLYADLGTAARRAVLGGAALQRAGALYALGDERRTGRVLAAAARLLPAELFAAAPPDPTAAEVWHGLAVGGD